MTTQYQVLARKYRPKNFDELIGQDHVSMALKNAIDTGRLHHAYLFTGTRGVGKTTIARILAKCLNCETGVTSTPCGVCDTCVSVDKGQFIDLIEIDAASRTKVEDTRDLLENVPYAPVQGRYKVYLIDEVHMLSTHSFNALLKTLEEPPEHAKFLFATTDPQKLPITIVSRCLQFVLRPLSQTLLSQHLAGILTQENIKYAQTALWQIAQSARGSVRDALSLTDQAIAFGGGAIGDETVNQMLGLIDGVDTLALLFDVYCDNRQRVADYIFRLRSQLTDANAIFERLIELVHHMAVAQVMPSLPLDMNDDERQKLLELSAMISAETLQLYYEILVKSKETLRFANTPMQGLEMAILRLLAFRPLNGEKLILSETPSNNTTLISNHSPTGNETPTSNGMSKSSEAPAGNTALMDKDVSVTVDLSGNTLQSTATTQDRSSTSPSMVMTTADDHQAFDVAYDENDGSLRVDAPNHANVHHQDMMENNGPMDGYPEPTDDNGDYDNQATFFIDNEPNGNELNNQQSLMDEQLINESSLLEADGADARSYKSDADEESLNEEQSDSELIKVDSSAVHNDQANTMQVSDSKSLPQKTPINHSVATSELAQRLKPTKAQFDESWNAEKWDYWVHLAREQKLLSADELALVSHAVMVGDVTGKAALLVLDIDNPQIRTSFVGVAEQLDRLFSCKVSLQLGNFDDADTPFGRQEMRTQQVLGMAYDNLMASPVMQLLHEENFLSPEPLSQVKIIG